MTKADHAGAVIAAAHELNNELTVILSGASVSILALEPEHPALAYLLELERAALRCARVSRAILAYGAGRCASPTLLLG